MCCFFRFNWITRDSKTIHTHSSLKNRCDKREIELGSYVKTSLLSWIAIINMTSRISNWLSRSIYWTVSLLKTASSRVPQQKRDYKYDQYHAISWIWSRIETSREHWKIDICATCRNFPTVPTYRVTNRGMYARTFLIFKIDCIWFAQPSDASGANEEISWCDTATQSW